MRGRVVRTIQTVGVISVLVSLLLLGSYIEHNYTRDATVTARVDDKVIVVDTCGYEWSFFVDSTDTISKGDEIKLKMDDNCTTNNIFDDKITGYKMR